MRRIFVRLSMLLLFGGALYACTRESVRTGAEVLLERRLELLADRRVGVLCNHTSVLPNGTHLVDTLVARGVKIVALFSPEHGIRGRAAAGEAVESEHDAATGIPIYSLYGRNRKPTPEMLQHVDVLLVDLQDVGARYYTYAGTMAYAMEAAVEEGISVVVLDRPNPINGVDVEGTVLDTTLRSLVGMFPIPARHGLTLGELARMIAGEGWIAGASKLSLTVVPMDGWKRTVWYDETGMSWIAPSPNMTTLATAIVYPGTCLFEGTNVSEGRGTQRPFEYIGAPWIDSTSIANALNRLTLPGVRFEPISFTPMADSVASPNPKYRNERCGGVYVHVTDRSAFRPLHTAITMLAELRRLYPGSFQFINSSFDRLAGDRRVRNALEQQNDPSATIHQFTDQRLEEFRRTRVEFLLY
jgi:uncharacterized protein YbbC (DUF1343 family)